MVLFRFLVAGVGFERPCEKHSRTLRHKVLCLDCSCFSPATARFFRRVAALAFAAHSLRCPPVGDTKSDLTYQKNEKQHRMVLFRFLVAGVGFEPHDLRVMRAKWSLFLTPLQQGKIERKPLYINGFRHFQAKNPRHARELPNGCFSEVH